MDLHSRSGITQVIYIDRNIVVRGGYTLLENNSMHDNTATSGSGGVVGIGGVCALGGSSVALTNTILVSHATGIQVYGSNTATLEGTLWGSGTWANEEDWADRGCAGQACDYWAGHFTMTGKNIPYGMAVVVSVTAAEAVSSP